MPESLLLQLEGPIRSALALAYSGNTYQCPVCGHSFRKMVDIKNDVGFEDHLCPKCGSIMRKRLLWLYLENEIGILQNSLRVLDFSPHRFIFRKLSRMSNLDYVATDYEDPKAPNRYDITAIPEADNSFDLILCYHILEHIPDDKAAMDELYRILKPGGTALIQSPHQKETYEDPNITDPAERLKAFGQEDHVRIYGREDLVKRLESSGFKMVQVKYAQELGQDLIQRHQLNPKEIIFVGKK